MTICMLLMIPLIVLYFAAPHAARLQQYRQLFRMLLIPCLVGAGAGFLASFLGGYAGVLLSWIAEIAVSIMTCMIVWEAIRYLHSHA